jgi:Chagasin family peptidase inhibitor I42
LTVERLPEHLSVRVGHSFEVALSEPSATGYLYEPDFDRNLVSYCGVNRRISSAIGGESIATFQFTARARGNTEICFRLAAPWDSEPAEERRVQLSIHP